jgi:hypothetical protein
VCDGSNVCGPGVLDGGAVLVVSDDLCAIVALQLQAQASTELSERLAIHLKKNQKINLLI